jgi:hypothetical protein
MLAQHALGYAISQNCTGVPEWRLEPCDGHFYVLYDYREVVADGHTRT